MRSSTWSVLATPLPPQPSIAPMTSDMNSSPDTRSHSQMPHRAASTASLNRAWLSAKAAWAASALRLCTTSNRLSAKAMVSGASRETRLSRRLSAITPLDGASIRARSAPPAAGRTARSTVRPSGRRPWARAPGLTSPGAMAKASATVLASLTPPSPAAARMRPSGRATAALAPSSAAPTRAARLTRRTMTRLALPRSETRAA